MLFVRYFVTFLNILICICLLPAMRDSDDRNAQIGGGLIILVNVCSVWFVWN